jgi:DNA polymerase sigma
VREDFTAKIPKIQFLLNGLECEVSLNNHMAYHTSLLLRDYMSLDPRVHTLAVAVRFWAKTCLLDRQAVGTMPPHAFAIMLVYFLQQEAKPVLPCIHGYLKNQDGDSYECKPTYLSISMIFLG